jgi:hypothetical protein
MADRETLESFLLSRGLITPEEQKLGAIRNKAIEQIEAETSDRAVAIVYASIIEEALGRCIRRFFVQTPTLNQIAAEKFGMSGPFGSSKPKLILVP